MTTGNVSVLVEPRRNLRSLENRVSECHANLLRTLNLHFAPTGSNWLITVYESLITHIIHLENTYSPQYISRSGKYHLQLKASFT